MKTSNFAVAAIMLGALVSAGSAVAGPISALYLTDFGGLVTVVQGGGIINTWNEPVPGADAAPALAVMSTVRTFGQGFIAPSTGHEFSLGGTPTGASYLNTVGCCFHDGTTDGTYNYAVRRPGGRSILYRFGLDWSNPEALALDFNGLGLAGVSGVTYDPRDGSFWFSDTNVIFNGTLAGDFVSGFLWMGSPFFTEHGLAFDSADNTLWLTGREGNLATLYQFSTSDTTAGFHSPLSTLTLAQTLYGGAEFALVAPTDVPEPATIGLLGLGLLNLGLIGLSGWRRRKTT